MTQPGAARDGKPVRVEVTQESARDLADYARVPIAFEVREVARVTPSRDGFGDFDFSTEPVAEPYTKDYDADAGAPGTWASQFDVSRWTVFVARVNGERVGGAAVVFDAPEVDMLRGRPDVALLWDIRVAPHVRGRGVGAALLDAVVAWAVSRGATWLEVETQDINVPACRFYGRNGFVLRAMNRDAYPDLPHETQLLWYRELAR